MTSCDIPDDTCIVLVCVLYKICETGVVLHCLKTAVKKSKSAVSKSLSLLLSPGIGLMNADESRDKFNEC